MYTYIVIYRQIFMYSYSVV